MDWLIGLHPSWEGVVERLGGGILGMAVGLLIVIPLFHMYGVFKPDTKNKRQP